MAITLNAVIVLTIFLVESNGFTLFGGSKQETKKPEDMSSRTDAPTTAMPTAFVKLGMIPTGAEQDEFDSKVTTPTQPDESPMMSLDEMEKSEIVPKFISKIPDSVLSIMFDDIEVIPGMELTPTQVQGKPMLEWPSEEGALYTIVGMDLDAMNSTSQFIHWLVVNVPELDVAKGVSVMDYLGSIPNEKSGPHKYVFMVYKQEKNFDDKTLNSIRDENKDSRFNHTISSLQQMLELKDAVAGNFYRAQFDQNVPKFMDEWMKRYSKKN